ncbi:MULTISPECIES: fatty acid--CoA ligase [unclassified Bradyrhizobium]|uniref:fatty acid--CoA ligase n=1 Tax=unclassified Bradyrhizobium TaxID=2631580 RepID=UPI00041FE53B|nr:MULTISPECIES: fatty acid--CoA ligase [unclassified Bradyrhizobium]QIG96618.1 fatty acid--CoA ligase [Bradyrhizobium sp. 6(2017)]
MSDFLIEHTPSAYKYPLLIKHLLHAPMTQAADQEIVYRDISRYTYRDLQERIGRLAGALTAQGVVRGDVVGVLDWDSPRYLECYFAIPMLGATLQTVNIRLSPEQVLFTLNHARPKLLLVNVEFLPLVEQLRDKLESVESIILISDDGSFPATAGKVAGRYEELLAKTSPDFAFQDFDENTRATMFYTTGTTGVPKGVYFSHRQLVLHTLIDLVGFGSPARQGRFHREDVYMPITPMFHVHGWGLPYAATAAGVKQVYPGRYQPDLLLELIKTEGVTFSHCVPTILQMLLSAPNSNDVDLSKLKMVIGGSALSKALAKAAIQRGIDIFAGYGMSESGPILTIAQLREDELTGNPDAEAELRTKTGTPVPLVDLRVVDDAMKDVPHDGKTSGEIVVRAPWLTMGYLGNPSASEKLWEGGYLHTGDIGTMSAHGVVQITDRMKDVIKTGGEWISSIELEDILMHMPGLKEAAIIGVADPKWGERPLAILVTGSADSVEKSAVQAHVKSYADKGVISRFAIPDRILFVDALDKTSVGKIDKKALRAKYGDG